MDQESEDTAIAQYRERFIAKRVAMGTPESQAVAEYEERENRIAGTMLALIGAKEHAKQNGLGKGSGGVGSLPCPLCKDGTVRYRVAGVNGHMHGICTTKGCVSWME